MFQGGSFILASSKTLRKRNQLVYIWNHSKYFLFEIGFVFIFGTILRLGYVKKFKILPIFFLIKFCA